MQNLAIERLEKRIKLKRYIEEDPEKYAEKCRARNKKKASKMFLPYRCGHYVVLREEKLGSADTLTSKRQIAAE